MQNGPDTQQISKIKFTGENTEGLVTGTLQCNGQEVLLVTDDQQTYPVTTPDFIPARSLANLYLSTTPDGQVSGTLRDMRSISNEELRQLEGQAAQAWVGKNGRRHKQTGAELVVINSLVREIIDSRSS